MRSHGMQRLALMTWLISAGFTVPAWADSIPICSYEVVRSYPHDPRAFTQGLLFKDGFLFESTGLRGQSSVRKVRLESGEVLQKTELGGAVFGEGLAAWQGSLIQLTWTTGIGFILSAADLEIQRTFRYQGEGWGLTQSDQALLMSDGSAQIRVLDPIEFKELHRINVTADGAPVTQLNELEWVDGEIYANVWHSDRIARIDPKTGHVKSWIDLTGLLQGFSASAGGEAVLNGIAYDSQRQRLLVTGKLWPRLFEIKLTGPAACQTGKHRS
jgi:glutamine cyclotransferase